MKSHALHSGGLIYLIWGGVQLPWQLDPPEIYIYLQSLLLAYLRCGYDAMAIVLTVDVIIIDFGLPPFLAIIITSRKKLDVGSFRTTWRTS